jgi:hypothetical protein
VEGSSTACSPSTEFTLVGSLRKIRLPVAETLKRLESLWKIRLKLRILTAAPRASKKQGKKHPANERRREQARRRRQAWEERRRASAAAVAATATSSSGGGAASGEVAAELAALK